MGNGFAALLRTLLTLSLCVSAIALAQGQAPEETQPTLEASSQTAPGARDSVLARPTPDSSGFGEQNFFGTVKSTAPVCWAEKPLFRIGPYRFKPFPDANYQEPFGWEIGGLTRISWERARFAGSGGMLVLLLYSERDDRVAGQISPDFDLGGREDTTSLHLSGDLYSRVGRRGCGAGLEFHARAGPEAYESWLSIKMYVLREEYRPLAGLGPQDWDVGRHAAAIFAVQYDDQERAVPKTHGIGARLVGTVGTGAAGGEFSYRKLLMSLERAWPRVRVWGNWGAASGHVPVQGLLDAAVEGDICGLPIRAVRTKGLTAGGVEGRFSLRCDDFFLRPFASFAHANGYRHDYSELGIALTGDYMEWGFHADNWVLRIDFPFYSSGADDSRLATRRSKWDLRRFMFRINLPVDFAGRTENVSYRYPNR